MPPRCPSNGSTSPAMVKSQVALACAPFPLYQQGCKDSGHHDHPRPPYPARSCHLGPAGRRSLTNYNKRS